MSKKLWRLWTIHLIYSAQNLVKRKSNTVGIILPVREGQDSLGNNPFFMQIIQGIAAVCTDQGYMVALQLGVVRPNC
nr:hypothetical protein [Streptococcus equi]